MKNRIKALTGYDALMRYISNTKWYRKLFDALLALILLIAYGMATGHIPVPDKLVHMHTVEATLNKSRNIQKILDAYQYNEGYQFIGRFLFHDGQSTLSPTSPFIKSSLFEWTAKNNTIDPLQWKDIPIQSNLKMVAIMSIDRKCYTETVFYDTAQSMELNALGITHVITCPFFDSSNIIGYIMIGSDREINLDVAKKLTDEISKLE